ncbi:MAG: hypothetical protein U1F49_13415 [Rubrivivax sp.]
MNTLRGSGHPGGQVIGGVPMVSSHATFGHLQSPIDATLVPGAKGRCIIGNTLVLKGGKPVMSAVRRQRALHRAAGPVVSARPPAPRQRCGGRAAHAADGRGAQHHRGGPAGRGHRGGPVPARRALAVVPAYDFHMGSYSVIVREGDGDTFTAVADPRRCAVADGLR